MTIDAIAAFFDGNSQTARGHGSAFSRPEMPEACVTFSPSHEVEGAGKAGCLLHPRSRVQDAQGNAHTSIQVQAEHSGLPCAVVLRLTSCSSRRTAVLPPSLRKWLHAT